MSDELAALKRKVVRKAKRAARGPGGVFVFILVIGLAAQAIIEEEASLRQRSLFLDEKPTPAGSASQPVSNPQPPAEILAYARSVADKWTKEQKSAQGRWPITNEEVHQLCYALSKIEGPPAAKVAASEMLQELMKLQYQQHKLDQAAEEKIIAETEKRLGHGRAQYASGLEAILLKQQYHDATVRVSGTENTTLTIKYVLMTSPMADNFMNYATITDAIGERGFKVVVLTDGYREWRFAVSKTGWKPMWGRSYLCVLGCSYL